jgi:hypothetical protein
MHMSRLLILPLLISICVAAQPVPGKIRKLGSRHICLGPVSEAAAPWFTKNLFPRPVPYQQLPTTPFPLDGAILKTTTPPPEWRLCRGFYVYVDEKGRIH